MEYQHALNRICAESARIWMPPPKLSLSEWADAYAFLSAESSAQPGKWTTIPYQRGIMDAMTDPTVEKITLMKSARVGYTKMLNHLIGYHIHNDPCPILVVQPTIEDAQGYSKDEIAPMLRDTPVIEPLCPELKTRDSANTILRKQFPGMTLMITGANSARGFRRISARIVIFDEVSAYPPSAGTEGDQITLGSRRADYYWNKLIVHGSTPTHRGDRIEALFEQSDQRHYYVPCPHCGHEQTLEWSGIDFSTKGSIRKPVYICASCEAAIEYSKHRWMIEHGRWIAGKGFEGHAGFHIWSAYSYSPNATWRHIVQAFVEAKDNPETLKTWVNTWRGETWEDQADSMDGNDIYDRREQYGLEVPAGAAILTASVDTQDDRLEVLVRAWGLDEESFGIDHVVINGDPARPELWQRLDAQLQKTYATASGDQLHIHAVAIDSGGHHTDRVYQFTRGRGARNIFAIIGRAQGQKPMVSKPSKKNKGKVPLFTVNTDAAKNLIMSRLKMRAAGPGYMHLSDGFSRDYCDQLTSERRRIKYTRGFQTYVWEKKPGTRNEAFDLEVYALGALRILCPDIAMLNRYIESLLLKKSEKKEQESEPQKQRRQKRGGGFVNKWKI